MITTDVVNLVQAAADARERKKKFSGSVEVLRFERTLDLAKRQLRRTDNVAVNDARLRSSLARMFHEPDDSRSLSLTAAVAVDPKSDAAAVPSNANDRLSGHGRVSHADAADSRGSGISPDARDSRDADNSHDIGDSRCVTASFTGVSTSEPATVSNVIRQPLSTSAPAKTRHVTDSDAMPLVAAPTTSATNSSEISRNAVTVTSGTKCTSSGNAVSVTSASSVAEKSTKSTDSITVTLDKYVDSAAPLANAVAPKSLDSGAATSAESVKVVAADKPVDVVARSSAEVSVASSFKTLPILTPVPAAPNPRSLSAVPQSPSPSPKGHVTFSDHVTEIQPGLGNAAGAPNGQPRRVPPAPPPRRAIKNVVATGGGPASSPDRPRDRPSSALEPLDGRPGNSSAVNGVGRARPLSMAPLATVDSDSDSSAGADTGTIRRNTSHEKRNLRPEQQNGGRRRAPPPVPARKTSSLSSSRNVDVAHDAQYSNLHSVRQECARLKLAAGQQDGRPNGPTSTGAVAKCEETEIY